MLFTYCLNKIAEYNFQVSLSGHLFDQFLINDALDIIEAAGGSFHLVKCQVGQSADVMSYSELEVSRHLIQFNFGFFSSGFLNAFILLMQVIVLFLHFLWSLLGGFSCMQHLYFSCLLL